MTIRERLQALLDGKAIYGPSTSPHRLAENGFEFLFRAEQWFQVGQWSLTNNLSDLLNPETKVDIHQEPKPEPTEREKFIKRYFSNFTLEQQLETENFIVGLIDERLKEMGK